MITLLSAKRMLWGDDSQMKREEMTEKIKERARKNKVLRRDPRIRKYFLGLKLHQRPNPGSPILIRDI